MIRDAQAKNQAKTQMMPGSKAHLPWYYVTIPKVPSSIQEFLSLRDELTLSGPESAVALYAVALLVYTEDEDLGKQCLVVASHRSCLLPARPGAKGSYNGMRVQTTTFLNRLSKYPDIARCLFMFSNRQNGYNPKRDGKKLMLKIRDCHVSETKGNMCLRAIWKECTQLPAGFTVKQNSKGEWAVSSVNPMCAPPASLVKDEDSDDEDDGPLLDFSLISSGPIKANPKHEQQALKKDNRSNKNSKLLTWVHHAKWDEQTVKQPKKQMMAGSKAHLPWAYVTIPKIPSTMQEFLKLRDDLGPGPEAAVALYAVTMLVFVQNENLGRQMMVVSMDKTCLQKAANASQPDAYKGWILKKTDRLMTMFLDRLKKYPDIARCLLFNATKSNRYDPSSEGMKLMYKIRDCSVHETKGDVCNRAIWKQYAKLPAGFQLHRNTRGVWKVKKCNPLCAPPAPPKLPVEDDGDDL